MGYCFDLLIRIIVLCVVRMLIFQLEAKGEGGMGWGVFCRFPWWRYQMETFSASLALCVGNSPVTGDFPSQRPVTRSFHVFFDLCLNKRLSKQSGHRWFETPSRSLWRHSNGDGLVVTGTSFVPRHTFARATTAQLSWHVQNCDLVVTCWYEPQEDQIRYLPSDVSRKNCPVLSKKYYTFHYGMCNVTCDAIPQADTMLITIQSIRDF